MTDTSGKPTPRVGAEAFDATLERLAKQVRSAGIGAGQADAKDGREQSLAAPPVTTQPVDASREHRSGADDTYIAWRAGAKTDPGAIARVGARTIGAGFVLFLLWATLLPLSSAVVTVGKFTASGGNQVVQHPVGGRVATISVREGQSVRAGETLVTFAEERARAELTRLDARHASLQAMAQRFAREHRGETDMTAMDRAAVTVDLTPTFSVAGGLRGSGPRVGERVLSAAAFGGPSLLLRGAHDMPLPVELPQTYALPQNKPAPGPQEDRLYATQRDAFRAGRSLLAQEIETIEKKMDTLEGRREGLLDRRQAQQRLLALARNEYERIAPLSKAGYIARNRAAEKEAAMLELQGTVAQLTADAGVLDGQIDELESQVETARRSASNDAAREMTRIVAEMEEIADQVTSARQTMSDVEVRAPVDGVVTGLVANTVGGVVGAGDTIAEIVPANAPLTVEARVSPADIDHVHMGQRARIAVTAFDRRLDDMVEGIVTYRAPDAETNERTGETTFTVRLAVEPAKEGARMEDLRAGMQAEVYIDTGSRTFATYMAKPLIDSFRRAFRER